MSIRMSSRVLASGMRTTCRQVHSTSMLAQGDVGAASTMNEASGVIASLSREVRTEELVNRRLRSTHKSIMYPADFSAIDPILDSAYMGGQSNTTDSQLPDIPPDTTGEGQAEDETELLARATGLTTREIKALIQRPLVTRRVVNQTRKGKQASMYTLAVVGNGNGMIGFGEGKHTEQVTATRKAVTQAVKNMEFVQRYQNRTIYGEFDYKFHAVQLRLRSRPAGFGLRANHFIYEICRCAGITDISAKVWGSRTGMNVVKAMFEALRAQKLPSTIAKERGRKIVDLEQTYYGK